jgi:adenosine kinase
MSVPETGPEILVTGSLAFDHIMDFPGNFKDHILPDKMHVINLSFLVGELKKQRGGCAANIAYSLALLEERARVLAAAGGDFAEYRNWLVGEGVLVDGIRIFAEETTASCFVTTDRANNQIIGFFPGAMRRAGELSLREHADGRTALAVIAPDDPAAMLRHAAEAREAGVRFLFDPSFQVIAFSGEQLVEGARGAAALVVNDYEFAVFCEKTGRDERGVLELVEMVVVTLGERGSELHLRGGERIAIPAVAGVTVVDPTGAGDAYRAGFAAGLVRGWPLPICGRMGSLAAAYAVERYGTTSHRYTRREYADRYAASFGERLPE